MGIFNCLFYKLLISIGLIRATSCMSEASAHDSVSNEEHESDQECFRVSSNMQCTRIIIDSCVILVVYVVAAGTIFALVESLVSLTADDISTFTSLFSNISTDWRLNFESASVLSFQNFEHGYNHLFTSDTFIPNYDVSIRRITHHRTIHHDTTLRCLDCVM